MARLIARQAVEGLPLTIGGVTMEAAERGPETLIAPYRGANPDKALRALGLTFPAAGTFIEKDNAAILWAGRGRALLVGAAQPEGMGAAAALVDQTGAQAVVLLTGPDAVTVLARLVPVDLRGAAFPVGAVVLTLIGHMTGALRHRADGIEVAVMRSMAGTLVHDLTQAAVHVAARAALVPAGG